MVNLKVILLSKGRNLDLENEKYDRVYVVSLFMSFSRLPSED